MVRPELLEAARGGRLEYSLVRDVAALASRPAPEILDELSCFVAERYATSDLTFEEADTIMNAAWTVCVAEEFWADYDRTIPKTTLEVYEAFDAGEYHHRGDPEDVDPELKYTKPLIEAFLSSRNRGT
jgi:hypothetical protein